MKPPFLALPLLLPFLSISPAFWNWNRDAQILSKGPPVCTVLLSYSSPLTAAIRRIIQEEEGMRGGEEATHAMITGGVPGWAQKERRRTFVTRAQRGTGPPRRFTGK